MWVRGNFGLKLQNSPKLPRIYMLDFIVMQMSKVNREKGHLERVDVVFRLTCSGHTINYQTLDSEDNFRSVCQNFSQQQINKGCFLRVWRR